MFNWSKRDTCTAWVNNVHSKSRHVTFLLYLTFIHSHRPLVTFHFITQTFPAALHFFSPILFLCISSLQCMTIKHWKLNQVCNYLVITSSISCKSSLNILESNWLSFFWWLSTVYCPMLIKFIFHVYTFFSIFNHVNLD